MYEMIRETVLKAIQETVEKGLIKGTSGNIAMRDPQNPNIIAITPSGISYTGMKTEDIAVVELQQDGTNKWIEGNYKPSSELPMHAAVMRARKEVNATVHTHSMYATICAMGEKPELLPITPPQCEFTPVGIVSFTMPGSDDVAAKVVNTLGEKGRVCLIKNHGMFSCGKNMKAAMYATVYTEEMAETTVIAKTLGNYEPMSAQAVAAMKALIEADQAV
ncbi:MAG: class II aldolase/adducin family protein [Lachnospiraceae bacterium]|nr:class II aldolase/adducin family protein [Lachnospiraceae bacterium]